MFRRILSLAPSNTEILFALGVGERVVGVTSLCDYPPEARRLPCAGSWLTPKDTSNLEALKSDLVLTSVYLPPDITVWAQRHGVALAHVAPQTLAEVYESIRRIGTLVGREEVAENLVGTMQDQLATVRASATTIRPPLKVYAEEFHKPPTVAANWVPELLSAAGGVPMAKPGIFSYPVTAEDVAAFDPDVIVLHWCGAHDRSQPEDLTRRGNGWAQLRAVQEGAVYQLDDTFVNRPGPRLIRGAKLVQELLQQHSSC